MSLSTRWAIVRSDCTSSPPAGVAPRPCAFARLRAPGAMRRGSRGGSRKSRRPVIRSARSPVPRHTAREGHMATRLLVVLASTPAALIGCHSSDDGLPTDPPTSVTKVSSGGFQSPTDAVASPDGRTFYFAAWDMDHQPTLFEVSSEAGGAPTALAAGDPMEAPMGLVM